MPQLKSNTAARRVAMWGRRGIDLLFPPNCVSCGVDLDSLTDTIQLCSGCRAALGHDSDDVCGRCGATIPSGNLAGGGCSRCRGRRFHFDQVIRLGRYQEPLRAAVLQIKRASRQSLALAVGSLLAQRNCQRLRALAADLVVPVPMHWGRRIVRSANSAELIAERLARDLRLPLARRVLKRRRNTLPQNDLSPTQRRHNVRGAFGHRAGYDIKGARVLLVDDILTTGATCHEAAGVLKKAGATHVAAIVVARAEGIS